MYGIELIIIIVATLCLSISDSGGAINVFALSIFWRLILGIGIGAGYPNSSVLVSEFATVQRRGSMMTSVAAAQGLGTSVAAFVSYLCLVGFGSSLNQAECDSDCRMAIDKAWRIVYGIGLLPALVTLYSRLTVLESIRYTLDVSRRETDAVDDVAVFLGDVSFSRGKETEHVHLSGGFPAPSKASFRDFCRFFGVWGNGKVLLGTAGSWFLIGFAFVFSDLTILIQQYGLALNNSAILETMGYGNKEATVFQKYSRFSSLGIN